MIKGQEFHSIIQNIFENVNGFQHSEQLQINCPMCQQREGRFDGDGKFNLEINTARRVFRCWKCEDPKFSGSLGRLIKLFGSSADYELYKSYAGSYGYDNYEIEDDLDEYLFVDLPSEMILFSNMDTKDPYHLEAYNYLVLDRQINRELLLKYRVGFCLTGKYAKRIIVPSYDKNGIVNYFIARNYDLNNKKKKPYDNPKFNKDLIIFNEGFINWDFNINLVEGVFEMFTLPFNTIPLLGKTISKALFLKLNEIKPYVTIILDPDAYLNGIEIYQQLTTIYVGYEDRVKIVKIQHEKDLDLVRRKRGIDEVINYLYSARDLNVDDYFMRRLENLNGRYTNYSKYFRR